MTQIEFGRLLNEMMEALDESKNEIISRTGIDRSTFFKFLNGKRFPTADQLNVIIRKSGISESDGRKLRKAYDETHYSHVLYNYIEVASQCLNAMMEASYIREYVRSKASPGTNLKIGSETIHGICGILQNEIQGRRDIEHAILTFLNSEIFRGGTEICCFLPLIATKFLIKNRNFIQHCSSKVHLLFRFSDTLNEISHHNAPQFYDLIPMALTLDCRIRFFYGESDLTDGAGLLFPYYVISQSGVLFLNSQLTEGVITQDKTLTGAYQREFDRAFLMAEEITDRIESLDDVRSVIVGQVRSMHARDHLLMLNHFPCMNLIATEDLVRKMITPTLQESMWAYSSMLQNASPIEIVSADGIRRMAETCRLEEYHYCIQTTRKVAHSVLLGLRERLGKTLYIADSSHLNVPEEWSVFSVPEKSVILIPQQEDSTAVSICEKNILHGFSTAFENSLEYFVMPEQKAEKILDYCIEETSALPCIQTRNTCNKIFLKYFNSAQIF